MQTVSAAIQTLFTDSILRADNRQFTDTSELNLNKKRKTKKIAVWWKESQFFQVESVVSMGNCSDTDVRGAIFDSRNSLKKRKSVHDINFESTQISLPQMTQNPEAFS